MVDEHMMNKISSHWTFLLQALVAGIDGSRADEGRHRPFRKPKTMDFYDVRK